MVRHEMKAASTIPLLTMADRAPENVFGEKYEEVNVLLWYKIIFGELYGQKAYIQR